MSRGPNVRRGEVVHATEDWGAGREFVCVPAGEGRSSQYPAPPHLIETDTYTDDTVTCRLCRGECRRQGLGRASSAKRATEHDAQIAARRGPT